MTIWIQRVTSPSLVWSPENLTIVLPEIFKRWKATIWIQEQWKNLLLKMETLQINIRIWTFHFEQALLIIWISNVFKCTSITFLGQMVYGLARRFELKINSCVCLCANICSSFRHVHCTPSSARNNLWVVEIWNTCCCHNKRGYQRRLHWCDFREGLGFPQWLSIGCWCTGTRMCTLMNGFDLEV